MTIRPLLLTVDVESDWGTEGTRGLDEALPRLLDCLDRHAAQATFFVVGKLASRFRRIMPADSPHEVGSHGLTHARLTRLSPREVRREVEESKSRLEGEGFAVRGFRAPFLQRPRGFAEVLRSAGFEYDASGGSTLPSLRNLFQHRQERDGLAQLPPSTLRDRLTPFSLTWLRLAHPLGKKLIAADASVFYCHLHELVEAPGGWHRMPGILRRIHGHNCGDVAWSLIEKLISDPKRELVSCSEYLRRARSQT